MAPLRATARHFRPWPVPRDRRRRSPWPSQTLWSSVVLRRPYGEPMRLVLKVMAVVVACAVVIGVGGYSYLLLAYPKVGAASALRVEATPERIARGKYIAEHVAVCTDCHSQRDWTRYAGPVKPETY